MDLGVLESQTRGDYFLKSIFDPSVKQCNVPSLKASVFVESEDKFQTSLVEHSNTPPTCVSEMSC